MRSQEEIAHIKARIIDPYSINNFLSLEDIDHLIELFESQKTQPNTVHKNTGPITLDINDYLYDTDPVMSKIIVKLKEEIGEFDITSSFFFTTDYPHVIHNDDTFELPDSVYKGITIPLKTYGSDKVPKLCFFDQLYFHGPAKFFNGDRDLPTYYNKQVYEYSDVDGLVNTPLVDTDKLFTHLKSSWLKGLSLHSVLEWRPGSAIIFDSVRLHCASDFRQLNIQSKLAISIFTKL
jgi:hypothetical protein